MKLAIKFLGVLREVSGKRRVKLEFNSEETVSLKKVIDKLIEEMPKLRKVLIDPELGSPKPNALILVNEKEISVLKGLETRIKDGDEIVIISILHAG
ncbi:MoaD/ThiS family protein [Candidatus Bathyarchaeota archaeon]|nr:MoaD/ThiS family protein [Candidatus Bathyarchaeota archaeon]RJS80412.1 MAG: MoaD/ThiS family protein [Candidatus Bathyarchaeota archaeon]